jgi:hypothetical protein
MPAPTTTITLRAMAARLCPTITANQLTFTRIPASVSSTVAGAVGTVAVGTVAVGTVAVGMVAVGTAVVGTAAGGMAVAAIIKRKANRRALALCELSMSGVRNAVTYAARKVNAAASLTGPDRGHSGCAEAQAATRSRNSGGNGLTRRARMSMCRKINSCVATRSPEARNISCPRWRRVRFHQIRREAAGKQPPERLAENVPTPAQCRRELLGQVDARRGEGGQHREADDQPSELGHHKQAPPVAERGP